MIPHFVDHRADEFGCCPLCGLVGSEVANKDHVFGFMARADHGRGVVGDGGVGWWTDGNGELGTPRCGIGSRGLDEADEVM